MAPLRYAAKFDPFLSLDCAREQILPSGNLDLSPRCSVLTESLVELDGGDGHAVAPVDLRVVAELGDPALGRAVRRPGVHQTVVDRHRHDGAAVRVYVLHNPEVDLHIFDAGLVNFVFTKWLRPTYTGKNNAMFALNSLNLH